MRRSSEHRFYFFFKVSSERNGHSCENTCQKLAGAVLWKKQSIGTEDNCLPEFLLQFKPEGIIKLLSILGSNVYTMECCFLGSPLLFMPPTCHSFIFSFLKHQQYCQFVAIVVESNAEKPNFLVKRQDRMISYKCMASQGRCLSSLSLQESCLSSLNISSYFYNFLFLSFVLPFYLLVKDHCCIII